MQRRRLVVVGGGFAGLWAAAAAAAARASSGRPADVDIALVTDSTELTVRPRLYEADIDATAVPLTPLLDGLGVELLPGRVTAVDTEGRHVTVAGADTLGYDAMVLAAGSTTPPPAITGAREHAHRIDTAPNARAFRTALEEARAHSATTRVTVVGGGLTGIELAAELAIERDLTVTLLDRGTVGAPFGPAAEEVVRRALTDAGIVLHDDTTVLGIESNSVLTDAEAVPHDVVVWCGGLRANVLAQMIPGTHDEFGRLTVTSTLQAHDVDAVWAAGDVARTVPDGANVAPMSCQFALPTGRIAGHNAAASLLGIEPVPFQMERYVTCIDLGAAGALFTTGWDRVPLFTGEDGKNVKRHINHHAIHPPDDPAALLAAAVPGAPAPWT